ncbi:MAG: hypothetical protein M3220_06630 [Chloroflexota bacterium]|nr:hypothetical protein [Chloroflexota bacterium]
MATNPRFTGARFRACSWGDIAAARFDSAWLGRVWESQEQSLLLVDQAGEVIRLVTAEIGDGPFHVVVPDAMAKQWEQFPRGLYGWRVGQEVWLGDDLTLHLPEAGSWQSTLRWKREEIGVDKEVISRHLALLGDWLLARAPEGSLAGVLPDLLATGGGLPREVADRPYLPTQKRLFRWRAARALGAFLPSVTRGDLAAAEEAVNHLAGLGNGQPPAGDWFMLGFMAGVQLWPEFLSEGSGLRGEALLQRLVRSVTERTSLLGRATLSAALDEHRWDARWHTLHAALTATGLYPDQLRDDITRVAAEWLEQDEAAASAGLGGIAVPFLWYQRFLL